ncbi:hypothetical protein [Halobacillus mangrovi]|uniref:Uncharacterized protein n=1 Tax=Halobacillus mangrovi TaxID=402384 RepID=A0A1W5ZQW6_9BACI|nr:hypothetical protein [Halobacillus mangrovi]ARI75683.1 hypothetical protein HM131_02055 [Halobacillus mangrovi]
MEITPYRSAGRLLLNMTKDEVQSQLKEKPKYVIDDDGPTEHYTKAGLLVHYSPDGNRSRVFEFVDHSKPEINGIRFLHMKAKQAQKVLKKIDRSVTEVADTYISEKLGISLYMLNDRVETLLVFEKGYYDEMFRLLEELENE